MSVLRALALVAGLVLVSAAPASAWPRHHAHGAPEIDPSGLGGAAALLVGGTFLLAPRRARRRPLDKP